MGGLSTAEWDYVTIDGRKCVQLKGNVSLANNGGFIQIALPLTNDGWPFDASSYKGVRIWVRGNGEAYHIHIRSSDSRLPWQYYGAEFTPDSSWSMFDIPFSDFEAESLDEALDPSKLTRIAVVATKKEFKSNIAVAGLEFYR
ncbi:CIA30 family protein, partial [Acidobacteriota bacterium]